MVFDEEDYKKIKELGNKYVEDKEISRDIKHLAELCMQTSYPISRLLDIVKKKYGDAEAKVLTVSIFIAVLITVYEDVDISLGILETSRKELCDLDKELNKRDGKNE